MSASEVRDGAPSRRILVVGGGTAGWLTACYLAKVLGADSPGGPNITLIESAEIGAIGVGEGTFPTIRNTLRTLGIDEAAFLRGASATFKQGIHFADWRVTPTDGRHEHYLHPFESPYHLDNIDLVPYWLMQDEATRDAFAATVTFQKRVADAQRAPKRLFEGDYSSRLSYAYHFDATHFARVLATRARELGVVHLTGEISDVHLDDTGAIGSLTSPQHGELTADLYVDCTGFASLLIGKTLNSPFVSVRSNLFADRAVACQVPYAEPDAPINSFTVSTAHEAGWTWDIGLNSRRGIGYVYSSDHTTDDRAEEVLRAYVGPAADGVTPRRIKFNAGYRESQWIKNCVAVGLSASFLEPLESTGIVLIEIAAGYIAEFLPPAGPVDVPAAHFNRLMKTRCEKIVNFLKLHYCLSQRTEPFWRDNADARSVPEELTYMLEMWKQRPPARFDFLLDVESFAHFNYQYILYGMGFRTDLSAAHSTYRETEAAAKTFAKLTHFGELATRDLPSHREMVDQVYAQGFSPRPADRFVGMNRR